MDVFDDCESYRRIVFVKSWTHKQLKKKNSSDQFRKDSKSQSQTYLLVNPRAINDVISPQSITPSRRKAYLDEKRFVNWHHSS